MNILALCHGNICRSPLAGSIIKNEIGIMLCRDAGLSDRANQIAAKRVRDYAANLGLDLTNHRSQQVTLKDCQWAKVILYMDGGNLKRIQAQFPKHASKAICLASYIGKTRLADPNYLSGQELQDALDDVREASYTFCQEYQDGKL